MLFFEGFSRLFSLALATKMTILPIVYRIEVIFSESQADCDQGEQMKGRDGSVSVSSGPAL